MYRYVYRYIYIYIYIYIYLCVCDIIIYNIYYFIFNKNGNYKYINLIFYFNIIKIIYKNSINNLTIISILLFIMLITLRLYYFIKL